MVPAQGRATGLEFGTLASGSRGNASLLRSGGAALLIDLGLGPRDAQERLRAVGAGWSEVGAVLLTHTHRDHIGPAALRWLAREGIVLYHHVGHDQALGRFTGFRLLQRRGLLRTYDERPFLTPTGARVEPIALSHDGGPTFGFRVEGHSRLRGPMPSVGYVADTGCWTEAVADALTDVDVLALEFNHDVALQRTSGRPWPLIQRNLGDRGHLSNAQAAELVKAVLERSRPGSVRHLVLLHLSQECNRPELASAAARSALRHAGRRAAVVAAPQERPVPLIPVALRRRRPRPTLELSRSGFPWELA